MSQENVEIVRRATALTNDGDVDGALQLCHPAIEWVIARHHPDARTLSGREAIVEYQREWRAMLPDVRVEIDRFLHSGETVVGIGTVRGTGTGSGADVRVPIAFAYVLSAGLIARVEEYLDPAEALEATGLEE
jgi:ketosteroid isomerase-like protein